MYLFCIHYIAVIKNMIHCYILFANASYIRTVGWTRCFYTSKENGCNQVCLVVDWGEVGAFEL